MRKATIIIIAAIYVASIVIVGVFGLQALVYSENIPITDFILPEQIEGKEVKKATDGNGYTVRLTYREDLTIPIEFVPVPADATLRNSVEVTIVSQSGTAANPTAVLEHANGYMLTFLKRGMVTVRITSTDNRKFSKELSITAV